MWTISILAFQALFDVLKDFNHPSKQVSEVVSSGLCFKRFEQSNFATCDTL